MGVGVELLFSQPMDGFESSQVNGRLIASRQLDLDSIAHDHDLPGIGEFVSFTREESETLAADMKWDAPEGIELKGKWFSPKAGHEVFATICREIESDPEEFDDSEIVLPELRKVRDLLDRADKLGLRFRLTVDY